MTKTGNNQKKITANIQNKCIGKEMTANEAKILPVCYRCTQVPRNGLYDGFRVKGMFFCSDCQQELFTAEQGSSEYQEFLFLIHETLFS